MQKESEVKIKTLSGFNGDALKVVVDEVKLKDGSIEKREVLRGCHPVCILAINDKNEIILERQFRYPFNDYIYEIPAGKINKDESPFQAAKRELCEESGYIANKITFLGQMYPNVGYSDEVCDIYLAENLTSCEQHLDKGEDLTISFNKLSDVVEMIKLGKIKEGRTIAAILFYLQSKNVI